MPRAWSLVVALVGLAVYAPAAASQEPENVSFASGFTAPTAIALVPDGRVFVAEQGGRVRVVKDGRVLAQPFLELDEDSSMERGLLGVTLDPDFESNGYLYAYYTRAAPVVNRISRFTVSEGDPDLADPGSELVLLDGIPSSHYHNGGAIHFGADGNLYVAVGDGLVSSNAQSLTSLSGKLLRIRSDGGIPADNPFDATTSGVYRAIWARGLRNPFTFDVEDSTGRIFINDVGENTHEEIDEAWSGPNDGSNAGFNFGWPATEGPTTNPAFHTPFHAYEQGEECAITGGAFYDPVTVNFPAGTEGDYFFADFCAGWIDRIDLATKVVSRVIDGTGVRGPIDIKVADDGSLFYLVRAADDGISRVRRVRYIGPGVAPSIVAHPQDTTVTVGAPATFEASASGTAPLRYQWQRDGEDIDGATSATYTVAHAELGDDGAEFRVLVTNGGAGTATSDAATLGVTLNRPPAAVIDAPPPGARYHAGRAIPYAGHASDPDGGHLTYTWRIDFHHEVHSHPFMPATEGSADGSFTIPTVGETSADVWYRIHLTVTDPEGLTGTAQRDVLPGTADLRLAANVPGLTLELDGQPFLAPRAVTGVVGIERGLNAPSPQTVDGRTYEFVSWSDGGARSHVVATPVANRTYTASYRDMTGPVAPPPAADPLVPPVVAPLPAPRLRVRAPERMTWAAARGRGIPVGVRGVPGARVRVVAVAGRRRLGSRSRLVGASGTRLIRVRARRGGSDRRRRVRLEVSAVLPGGRRLSGARRIVLVPRR